MTAAYYRSFETTDRYFHTAILAAGSVVAEENGALSSWTFTTVEAGFNLDYSNDNRTRDRRTHY
jgi:hypothetical protein